MKYKFKAIKGIQFDNEVFTCNIGFDDLGNMTRVDSEVQRKKDSEKVASIVTYILESLKGDRPMSGFSAIVTSARYEKMTYNEDTCDLEMNTQSKLYISDGQHRAAALNEVKEFILNKLESVDISEEKVYWEKIYEKFANYTIPVIIFLNLNKANEQQLFHDMNNLATPVNPSQALKYDQNDKYNMIAKEIEQEIDILRNMGINKIDKSLNSKSTEIATLKIWNNAIRILLNGPNESDMKKPWNSEWNYNKKKDLCKTFWEIFFDILPEDFNNKEKYIVTNSGFIQGVAAFGYQILTTKTEKEWRQAILKLQDFNWAIDNDIYGEKGGLLIVTSKNVKKFKFKGTRAAINSVSSALQNFIIN
ncbi:DNA sulfur modification protein DndB [Clostridium sp.]|uniref:DNA sulfur modification protein DndB n=1 Tax=Clostridium sp. TaxID=1506 RepID=UPI0039944866